MIHRIAAASVVLLAACSSTGTDTASSSEAIFGSGESFAWNGPARTVFSPSAELGGEYYAYAPAVVEMGGVDLVFSCENPDSGRIQDHIEMVEIDHVTGRRLTAPRVVLGAPVSARRRWNSMHACDPSVVRGNFRYDGATYRYALFYTGNPDDGGLYNQVGVAFSNDLFAGSWTPYPLPIVRYPGFSDDQGYSSHDHDVPGDPWGVGQPSATTVDEASGRLLLTYTIGDANGTRVEVRDVTLGDMSAPTVARIWTLPTDGLTDPNGAPVLRNMDIAYDTWNERFYAVHDLLPAPNAGRPSYISSAIEVASISGTSLWSGSGAWTVLGTVTAPMLASGRAHDGGISRNEWGMIVQHGALRVYGSTSCADDVAFHGCGDRPEWTYGIDSIDGHYAR